MKYLFLCSIAIVLFSCTRRPQEFVSFSAINNSGATIKLFLGNSSDAYSQFNSEKGVPKSLVNRSYNVTTISEANFNSVFTLSSPVKVVFNNTDTVYHYNDMQVHTGKYINRSSDRCLFNLKSYVINKDRGGEVAVYTFTESDFDFAKD